MQGVKYEQGVKYVQSQQKRQQNDVNDVVLVSLLLTLNMFLLITLNMKLQAGLSSPRVS